MTEKLGEKIQLVGDICSSPIPNGSHGIEKGIANSILIKVNQIVR